jgi:hypothetical protein
MNKYEKWYEQIVQRAKDRVLDGYYERHHILPRSLGGLDTSDNLVCLTAREHFICHWLLTKFTIGEARDKMIYALRMMRANKSGQRYSSKITARVYENLKIEYVEIQRQRILGENNPMYGRKHSEEVRRIISEKNTGNKLTTEQLLKQIKAQTGRKREPFSEEWKHKMSEAHKGEKNHRYGVKVSEETRAKISEKMKGRKQSEEEKARRSLSNLGKTKPKKLCPHCDKMISVNTYPRWHGDNCKQNT